MSLPKPQTYVTQAAPNCWKICRETYSKKEPDGPIYVGTEVLETYDTPIDAYAALQRHSPPELANPIQALLRLYHLASTAQHSAGEVAARVLLGCYNGYRFPFDLTELRRLDTHNFEDAIAVIRFDVRPAHEVHEWLNLLTGRTDFGARFEWLATKWRIDQCHEEAPKPAPFDMTPYLC